MITTSSRTLLPSHRSYCSCVAGDFLAFRFGKKQVAKRASRNITTRTLDVTFVAKAKFSVPRPCSCFGPV